MTQFVAGIAAQRDTKDFSARDCAVLDLVRPHLVHARRVAAERETLGALEQAIPTSTPASSATRPGSMTNSFWALRAAGGPSALARLRPKDGNSKSNAASAQVRAAA